MITTELDNFSLDQICRSGQCFRMNQISEDTYALIAGDKYLEITQHGTIVDFHCSDAELVCYWVPYFDLDADYGALSSMVNSRDTYLTHALACGSGIRILRQDLWETIVSFLISQQNNIPRIKKCIEKLCTAYGEKKLSSENKEYYAFPTPYALANAPLEELKALGLGYRARYISETAKSIYYGEISLEKIEGFCYSRRAKKELMKLCGVGEKIADCICLFSLHHLDAFPVDTHIRQVLDEHYKRGFPNRRYRRVRGIMQQYIFYYELNKND